MHIPHLTLSNYQSKPELDANKPKDGPCISCKYAYMTLGVWIYSSQLQDVVVSCHLFHDNYSVYPPLC